MIPNLSSVEDECSLKPLQVFFTVMYQKNNWAFTSKTFRTKTPFYSLIFLDCAHFSSGLRWRCETFMRLSIVNYWCFIIFLNILNLFLHKIDFSIIGKNTIRGVLKLDALPQEGVFLQNCVKIGSVGTDPSLTFIMRKWCRVILGKIGGREIQLK